jgi:hypothetical protein
LPDQSRSNEIGVINLWHPPDARRPRGALGRRITP